MPISEIINKECLAHVQNITTCPFLGCDRPKFWEQVDATLNVSQWHNTTDMPTTAIKRGWILYIKLFGSGASENGVYHWM